MINEDKLKREKNERFRKTWISIQIFFLVVVTVILAGTAYLYFKTDEAINVEYTQSSEVDYNVYINNADGFYGSEPVVIFGKLDSVSSYVATSVEKIVFNFDYKANMNTQNTEYEYKYWVDAQFVIKDGTWNSALLDETTVLVPEVSGTENSSNVLNLSSGYVEVSIADYITKYHQYVELFELDESECELVVKMHVNVASDCDATDVNTSEYVVYATVPLTKTTTKLSYSNPTTEGVISGCNTAGTYKELAKSLLFILGSGELVLILLLILFLTLTKTPNVDYANNVKKIIKNYSSHILQIKKKFSFVGYQVVELVIFNELLEIHDTIKQPILMHENDDKTCTNFIIPTESKIMYVYQVAIEGYEEPIEQIFAGKKAEQQVIKEESVQEEVYAEEETLEESQPEVVEEIVEEVLEELVEEPIEETQDVVADAKSEAKLNYSFEAKLILADEKTKEFYKEIVTFAKSYGVKVVRSFKRERIYLGRDLFAILVFKGKRLCACLPLDPSAYTDSNYKYQDMSAYKKYEEAPFLMKITSGLKVRHVNELLEALFVHSELENQNLEVEEIIVPEKTKEELALEGLIKDKTTII